MEEVSVLHFNGGVRIISDSDAPLSPSDKYIFGYHVSFTTLPLQCKQYRLKQVPCLFLHHILPHVWSKMCLQNFPVLCSTVFASALWAWRAQHVHSSTASLVRVSLPLCLPFSFCRFQPHGLMPAILAWLPMTGAWRRLFPGVNPVGLVATAIFKVPILRDLNLWGGLREVSKASFVRALHEKKAVLLCPGGQVGAYSCLGWSPAVRILSCFLPYRRCLLSERKHRAL